MDAKDRRAQILKSTVLNGIDFVEIASPQQTTLRVHFLNDVQLRGSLSAAPLIDGGETIASVTVLPIDDSTDWGNDTGHLTLTLRVQAPGDFSNYTLHMQSAALDQFFSSVQFSFKALCPSDLDCEPPPVQCPPVTADVPPIDYLAKDFLSFRQALLDFSALRYPQWQERSEADFGMMFLEALAGTADDLSYTQDRVAAEATLETATQRRSVVRHARLVDYEPAPAMAASVILQFDVAAGVTQIADGLAMIASAPDGSSIVFETGNSLVNRLIDPDSGALRSEPPSTPASPAWNRGVIQPYWFDDSQRCLNAGATQMYVLGRGYKFIPGQALLIETQAATSADPPIRQIVHLLEDVGTPNQWATELMRSGFHAAHRCRQHFGAVHDLSNFAAIAARRQRAHGSDPYSMAERGRAAGRSRSHANSARRQPGSRHSWRDCRRRAIRDRCSAAAARIDPGDDRKNGTAADAGRRHSRHSAGDTSLHAGEYSGRMAARAGHERRCDG